ncbi:hypothetical protein GCM10010433_56050 [Streptomyces pulveraceus]
MATRISAALVSGATTGWGAAGSGAASGVASGMRGLPGAARAGKGDGLARGATIRGLLLLTHRQDSAAPRVTRPGDHDDGTSPRPPETGERTGPRGSAAAPLRRQPAATSDRSPPQSVWKEPSRSVRR